MSKKLGAPVFWCEGCSIAFLNEQALKNHPCDVKKSNQRRTLSQSQPLFRRKINEIEKEQSNRGEKTTQNQMPTQPNNNKRRMDPPNDTPPSKKHKARKSPPSAENYLDLNLPPPEDVDQIKIFKSHINDDIIEIDDNDNDVEMDDEDVLIYDEPPPSLFNNAFKDDYVSLHDEEEKKPIENLGDPFLHKELPPWAKKQYDSDLWGLHEEINDFMAYISPSEAEKKIRETAIYRIKTIISSLWSTATVEVFGSFNTGIYLPSSDIDLVILCKVRAMPVPLYQLAQHLKKTNQFEEIQVVSNAKVPIIKFKDIESECRVDISFNVANGLQNTIMIKEFLEEYYQLKPLVLILKLYLTQRGLNEPYSGGLGSYALILMLVNFLQVNKTIMASNMYHNLGYLLVEFFYHYGRRFNYYSTGITCRNGGAYFLKADRRWLDVSKPYLLSIEDPQDEDNDVGRPSHRIVPNIQQAFTQSYLRLVCIPEKRYVPTLLCRILYPMDPIFSKRLLDFKQLEKATDTPVESQNLSKSETKTNTSTSKSTTVKK